MTRAVAVISPCFLTECSEISSPHSHHPSFGNTHRKLVPSFMGCTLKLRASTSCFDLKLLSSESSSQPREKALMSLPLPRSVLCQAPRWNTRVGKIKHWRVFPHLPFPFSPMFGHNLTLLIFKFSPCGSPYSDGDWWELGARYPWKAWEQQRWGRR